MIAQPPLNAYVQGTTVLASQYSDYYKDLADKYKIDEQYAKNKTDKEKYQKLYKLNKQKQKQEKKEEDNDDEFYNDVNRIMTVASLLIFLLILAKPLSSAFNF